LTRRAFAEALYQRALTLLENGCKKRIADACDMLASTYENGTGRPRDAAKAREFRRSACELRDRSDCTSKE
jgi:TPR repeat protein